MPVTLFCYTSACAPLGCILWMCMTLAPLCHRPRAELPDEGPEGEDPGFRGGQGDP